MFLCIYLFLKEKGAILKQRKLQTNALISSHWLWQFLPALMRLFQRLLGNVKVFALATYDMQPELEFLLHEFLALVISNPHAGGLNKATCGLCVFLLRGVQFLSNLRCYHNSMHALYQANDSSSSIAFDPQVWGTCKFLLWRPILQNPSVTKKSSQYSCHCCWQGIDNMRQMYVRVGRNHPNSFRGFWRRDKKYKL